MSQIDFSITTDYELIIQNGDFVQSNQELQHGNCIIRFARGEVRQYPLVGVGIDKYVGSTSDINSLQNIIDSQLRNDNLLLDDIELTQNGNQIEFDITLK